MRNSYHETIITIVEKIRRFSFDHSSRHCIIGCLLVLTWEVIMSLLCKIKEVNYIRLFVVIFMRICHKTVNILIAKKACFAFSLSESTFVVASPIIFGK